jgi:hypothetical protein
VAIEGTPVVVVFFKSPVAKPARDVPFKPVTVEEAVMFADPLNAGLVYVTSPVIPIVRPVVNVPALPDVF